MTIPKVSIIIPNYNHEKYLDQRIQSVLNQDFCDFEVILLDDASTDKSLDVIQRYSNYEKFKIEVNIKNSGSTFSQWRKGIALANGEYIWIAESDDLAEPNFLSTLVSKLDTNPNIVLAYCQSNYINEDSDIIGSAKTWTDDLDAQKWNSDYINNGVDECKFYLSIKNTIPNASAVVFRHSSFNQIDTTTNMRLCGDWLIWSRLIRLGDLAFFKEKLNYFRIHTNNVRSSTSNEITAIESMNVSQEVIAVSGLDPDEKKIVFDKLFIFWRQFLLNYKYITSFKYLYYLAVLIKLNSFKLILRLIFAITYHRIIRYMVRFKYFIL